MSRATKLTSSIASSLLPSLRPFNKPSIETSARSTKIRYQCSFNLLHCITKASYSRASILVVRLDLDFDGANDSLDNKSGERREGFFTVLRDPPFVLTAWVGGGRLPVARGDREGWRPDLAL